MSDIDLNRLLLHQGAAARTEHLSLDRQRQLLRVWLVVVDAVALCGAFYLAYVTRFDWSITVAPEVPSNPAFYLRLASVLTPLFLCLFAILRLYNIGTLLGGVTEYSRTFSACTHGHMILVLATFIDTGLVVSRAWVVASWVFSCCSVIVARFATRRVVYYLRTHGFFLTPAVVVGTNSEAQALYRELADPHSSGLQLMGYVQTGREGSLYGQVLGHADDLEKVVSRYGIEDVIVAITSVDREQLSAICESVNPNPKARLRLSSGLYELLTTGVTTETSGQVPLIGINKGRLEPGQLLAKTTFEFLVSLGLVLLLTPLLLAIVVAIRVGSPGPIIHRRRVLGVSGREFDAFKFRTMYTNGQEILRQYPDLKRKLENDHKLRVDPRITPVGRLLRRYSLDELPQLFNVLRGEMGLVGPRMISPAEAAKYGKHKLNLLTVRPGVTGLWQVSGRADLSYEERIRLDMFYIRNYSIWSDLQILCLQTLPAVLNGRGAY